ncbi:MAG: adenylate/guanylate cyclase domain-containing protein [Pseudomonadota bacterium]|nr:adenylate/guanylate cyclase domain-containing protein [Pseudomonadota bacterium]
MNLVAAGWRSDPLAAWMMTALHRPNAEADFFSEFCGRLLGEGIPVGRVFCGLLSLHPQFVSRNLIWTPEGGYRLVTREHGVLQSDFYLRSPIRLIHQGADSVRQRLDVAGELLEFDVWRELKAEGMTDYVALPLRFSTGETNVISYTTTRPGGFRTAELARLYDLLPLLSIRLELANAYFATVTLMSTYLGEAAARRVLAGTIRRAEGEAIRAAIYLCDLRNFTAISDRTDGSAIISMLDDYFDCMIAPIRRQGGEVLKFMGDAMLAMFPMDDRTAGLACRSALRAAEAGSRDLARLSAERVARGEPRLLAGVGLHAGDVIFGNIGSEDRLDFTVIGRAVNEVSRVEALTRTLARPILMTAGFARLTGRGDLLSLGDHVLPGVSEPTEIFAPPPG